MHGSDIFLCRIPLGGGHMTFKMRYNTDSVDINALSLGIDAASLESDLSRNRGLHIQVKHNGDSPTFKAATALQDLLVAAPDMLSTLRLCEHALDGRLEPQNIQALIGTIRHVIKNATMP